MNTKGHVAVAFATVMVDNCLLGQKCCSCNTVVRCIQFTASGVFVLCKKALDCTSC